MDASAKEKEKENAKANEEAMRAVTGRCHRQSRIGPKTMRSEDR